MAIRQPGLSLEDFLKWPEKKPALEYFDGMVTQKVSPNLHHGALEFEVAELFNRFGRRRKIARAFPELRTTFAGMSPVPDVSVYLWDRIPRDPSGRLEVHSFVAPDIAIEIASPGQSVNALLRRCRTLIARGVRVAVLVNPRTETVYVVRSGSVTGPLRGAQQIELGDVLPGFELAVQDVFEALR